MFKISTPTDNQLNVEMSGKLDADTMRVALDEFVEKTKSFEHGRMLYDIVDFHLPTLEAMGVEFSRLPSMFGLLKKIERAAVLTDKTWLKKISELEGALIPGLEIKAFDRSQRAEAEAWLSS